MSAIMDHGRKTSTSSVFRVVWRPSRVRIFSLFLSLPYLEHASSLRCLVVSWNDSQLHVRGCALRPPSLPHAKKTLIIYPVPFVSSWTKKQLFPPAPSPLLIGPPSSGWRPITTSTCSLHYFIGVEAQYEVEPTSRTLIGSPCTMASFWSSERNANRLESLTATELRLVSRSMVSSSLRWFGTFSTLRSIA